MYFLPVLEARSVRSECGWSWFLLSLCPWLAGGRLLPVSFHTVLPQCQSVSSSLRTRPVGLGEGPLGVRASTQRFGEDAVHPLTPTTSGGRRVEGPGSVNSMCRGLTAGRTFVKWLEMTLQREAGAGSHWALSTTAGVLDAFEGAQEPSAAC